MSGPLVPLALLAASVWLVRRTRSRAKAETASDGGTVPLVLIPVQLDEAPVDAGAAGEPCEHEQGPAAWDRGGRCKVFWFDGDTDDAIASLARARWEGRGKPTISEMCFMVPDPLGGEFAAPVDNPIMVEIVAGALHEYYGVAGQFPPVDDSHYWVKTAWKRASAVVMRELCGAQ